MVLKQKTVHFKSGHIGEKVHEERGSHLSDAGTGYNGDMDIVFEAGLGLALNDEMTVIAVSEKGQAYQAGVCEGDVLVGYDTIEKQFSNAEEVKQLVDSRNGNISMHFNSMPVTKKREIPAVEEKHGSKIPIIVACALMAGGATGAIVCGTGHCSSQQKPTQRPTRKPTRNPTKAPTPNPTSKPTQSPTECSKYTIGTFDKYPDYTGSISVTGTVDIMYMSDGKTKLSYDLAGLGDACKDGATAGIANSCGIHFHAGTSCDTHNDVGGHYYDKKEVNGVVPADPWADVIYGPGYDFGNDKYKSSTDEITYGYNKGATFGHTFVVHDSTGARVSCTLIPGTC